MDRRLDEQFMMRALALARLAAEAGEVPIGAVVVDAEGNIVGEGENRPIRTNDPTAHAEIVAMRAAAERLRNYRLPGLTLYVTLEPCTMCAGAMVHARIARLVYGAPDPKAGATGSIYNIVNDPRLNHRMEITPGEREEDCRNVLQEFFRTRRRL